MAEKITQLPSESSPNGGDLIPDVDSATGQTSQISESNLATSIESAAEAASATAAASAVATETTRAEAAEAARLQVANNLSDVASAGTAFGNIKQSATSGTTGVIELSGDLGNTATSPQVVGTHLSSALPVTQGGTGTATAMTAGSVVFVGPSGVLSQNNGKLFWDNSTNQLGIGTPSPEYQLHLVNGGNDGLMIQSTGDHPNLYLQGSAGTSYIQGGFNGNQLALVSGDTATAGTAYYGATAAIGGGTFAWNLNNPTSGDPLMQAGEYSMIVKWWNGSTAVYALLSIIPIVSAAGVYRLAFNVNGTENLSITNAGLIGVHQVNPTAQLDMPASTASNASIRIRSGVAPTSPNDGDEWYDGSHRWLRIGATNYQLDQQLATIPGYLPAYNVQSVAYGAKGNTNRVTDGAITTGTATLTSATASFTSADAGKIITVAGAGSGTQNLQSTIQAYVSSTSVTLANNANVTVTGATTTYGTSDTAAIQAALNAAQAAGGGIVVLPPGNYRGNNANYDILYVGYGVILQGGGVYNTTLQIPICIGTTTQGSAAPLVKGAYLRDFMMDGTAYQQNQSGVTYRNVQDCHVQNFYMFNVPYWNIVGAFESGVPMSPSLYLENVIFDRNLNIASGGQDMSAFNSITYLYMYNVEFRNNTLGSSLLTFGPTVTLDFHVIRIINCNAYRGINVNAFNVTIEGFITDGNVHQIAGQSLHLSDFQDIAPSGSNAASFYISSAGGTLVNGHLGQTVGCSTGAINLQDYYNTPFINPAIVNAVAHGATTVTFSSAPNGFVNGEIIQLDQGAPGQENVTLQSGAGTTTWTLAAPTANAHAAGIGIIGFLPTNITVMNSKMTSMFVNLTGTVASMTLAMQDVTLSSYGNLAGYLGIGENTGLTLATTMNLRLDNVKTCGAIALDYFAPAANYITYKGWMRNVSVYGNSTTGGGGAGTIRLSQNIQMLFENNDLWTGFSTSGTPSFTATGTLFKNNRNIQTSAIVAYPTGVGTTPSVPSSGTVYTNNSMTDATIYVSGGTVTAIAINGTATGLTSGMFRVPSQATITLTYSVAPTWVWNGD
jgi:hypothetical protein